MNVINLLMDLNKEFYLYKNDIFLTKFFKRTYNICNDFHEWRLRLATNFTRTFWDAYGSTCKVNTKSASIAPPPLLLDVSFQIYYSSIEVAG